MVESVAGDSYLKLELFPYLVGALRVRRVPIARVAVYGRHCCSSTLIVPQAGSAVIRTGTRRESSVK